jgi:hypothetical protein
LLAAEVVAVPVAMNGGCGDIIKGIELAYRVYDIGFTYDNRAGT